jgi:hypothetical protein|tara:strand:+ start:69 stop:515 length:447 start_codon:yes stop_codon:yes gene_type:complete
MPKFTLIFTLLFVFLFSTHKVIIQAAPEDYVEPSPEDEDFEEDEEIIVRDDGTVAGERPKLAARPPFTLHDYNATLHAWISPVNELKTLKASIETSYERVSLEFTEAHLSVEHLLPFMEYILNPDFQEVTEEETEMIGVEVARFKEVS